MHVLRQATRRPMLQVMGHAACVCCGTLHQCFPLASLWSPGLPFQPLQLRHCAAMQWKLQQLEPIDALLPMSVPKSALASHDLTHSFLTTSVAATALLLGKSMVWAFDRDLKRLQRLQKNAAAAGAHNITAQKVCLSCFQSDFFLLLLLPVA